MSEFDYLLKRIKDSEINVEPFIHLEIDNFLSPEHLSLILTDDQIHFPPVNGGPRNLVNELTLRGYNAVRFPGCLTSLDDYLKKLVSNVPPSNDVTEGFGMAFRLKTYKSQFLKRLMNFFNSPAFRNALLNKFQIKNKDVRILSAVQKYLTGYEISPHCDIRQKCMTYLLNINRDDNISEYDIHTHLLKLKPTYEEAYDFWKNHTDVNRCWVPWSWCDTVKKVRKNNTIVIFPPSYITAGDPTSGDRTVRRVA